MPIVRIPDVSAESGKLSSGLGDIVFTAFYVPKGKGLTWGFGPAFEFPTGGTLRGSQKCSIGPSLVFIAQPGEWTFGTLINNTWSYAGSSELGRIRHF